MAWKLGDICTYLEACTQNMAVHTGREYYLKSRRTIQKFVSIANICKIARSSLLPMH